MALGKMNNDIKIITTAQGKDAQGFAATVKTTVATVKAYFEQRNGSEKWANRAAFSTATALFRFRVIEGVNVDTAMTIEYEGVEYRILNVNNAFNRNMYTECLCERVEGSKR